jgi:acyl carrier protein
MSTLKAEVRGFVVKNFLFGQEDGLQDEASLLEQGIMDSTGVLELVAFLEKELGVKVEDAELVPENLDSVEAIAAFVARKRGGQTAER